MELHVHTMWGGLSRLQEHWAHHCQGCGSKQGYWTQNLHVMARESGPVGRWCPRVPSSTDAEDRLRIPKSSADFGILVGQGLGTNPLQILRSHCVVPPGGKPFSLPPGICDSHTPHAYIRVSLPVRWGAHMWRVLCDELWWKYACA